MRAVRARRKGGVTITLIAALLLAGFATEQNDAAARNTVARSSAAAATEQNASAAILSPATAATIQNTARVSSSAKAAAAQNNASETLSFAKAETSKETEIPSARSASAKSPTAQNIAADTLPGYFYCEISAPHLLVHRASDALFDYGQKTGAWKSNFLTDDQGNKLLFGSDMEALNYVIRQGWEFVQAYASGKGHYLLRIVPERLTDAQRAGLLAPPKREPPKKEDR